MNRKSVIAILSLLALLLGLTGCIPTPLRSQSQSQDTKPAFHQDTVDPSTTIRPDSTPASQPATVSLRIIAEADRMQSMAEQLAKDFQTQHENVTVKLEFLPQEGQEREQALASLRQEIAQGRGPDGFLLPTHSFRDDLACGPLESLFPSAAEAAENGTFLDVSQWYDTDEVLASKNYRQEVLKAGRLNGRQYLLPLFYNFPVLFRVQNIPGVEIDRHGVDIDELFEDVLEIGNSTLAAGVYPTFLPHGEGYNLLTVGEDHAEDLQELLQYHGALQALAGDNSCFESGVTHYIYFNHCLDAGYPMSLASLAVAMDYAAIAKSQGQQLFMDPVCNDDGELVASITRYAAVSASSQNPELTYQFLRTFLDEPAQVGDLQKPVVRSPRMHSWGYPVLDYNTAAALWDHNFAQYLTDGQTHYGGEIVSGAPQREQELFHVQITDADIPVLGCKIDRVRIPDSAQDWALNQAFRDHGTDHVNDNTSVAHNYQEHAHKDTSHHEKDHH